jgi:hypothetical protein
MKEYWKGICSAAKHGSEIAPEIIPEIIRVNSPANIQGIMGIKKEGYAP